MDEAARSGRAARDALSDVDPDELRREMESVVDEGSKVPGALTLLAAEAVGGDPGTVTGRAAGVQLTYAGLGAIRELARADPWAGNVLVADDGAVTVTDDLAASDLAVLSATVLVSRGFHLLARTDASGKAIETIRAFGRDQTLARASEARARLDVSLEVDCLELAVVAGTTGVGADPLPELLEAAGRIAREAGAPLPPAETVLAEPLAAVADPDPDGDTASLADAIGSDSGTSATDP